MVLAFAIAVALSPHGAAGGTAPPLDRQLDAAFNAFPATAALIVSDPASGFRYARNADMQFFSASLYKLGLMVEAYRQATAGSLSLDDTVIGVTESDLSAEDGWFVDAGTELSVREALEWTIAWSDNSTALALLRTLDVANVNATLAALGLTRTWVDQENGNLTTAGDLERLFGLLLRGKIVSPAASAEMLQLLTRQRVSDRLSTGLPEGTVMAHKTGNLAREAHDAGIIWTPFGPRIVVVLTSGWSAYEEVIELDRAVAAAVYATALDRFGATLASLTFSSTAVPGAPFPVTLRVTNTGSYRWSGERLLLTWTATTGARVRQDSVTLPELEPGRSAIVALPSTAPATGVYLAEIQVVSPRLGSASAPLRLSVRIAKP